MEDDTFDVKEENALDASSFVHPMHIGVDVKEDLEKADATEPTMNQLLERAAENNTSLTAPWSLVLNGPEEAAYEATLISRHMLGFVILWFVFTSYGLKRAVVVSTTGDLVWSGTLASVVYFTNTGIIAALAIPVLYLRFCCDTFAHRRVIRKVAHGACFIGYLQSWIFIVGSGLEAKGDELAEFNYALWTGTALTVMPLIALCAGLSFHWNALGYIGILIGFGTSPVIHEERRNPSVILLHSVFHFAVVLGVTYAMEAVSRNSFLVSVKNVGLIRKERESAREAVRMSASFSRCVSTIAHDIKTPLAAVKIGVDLSIKLFKKQELGQIEVILDSMCSATQMAMTFLDGLSASAALLDRGDRALEPTLSDLSIPEVINSALAACKLWSVGSVRLTSSVQEGLTHCKSSETMLSRNLLNLVTNAIKHTAEGCVQVYAGFRVFEDQPEDTFLEFLVSDTGTGVCSDYHDKSKHDDVWLPFESGAKSTGLGLFVVKQHSEALGGRCGWVPNQPQGSVFWFAVPFIRALTCGPENGNVSCTKGRNLESSFPLSVPPLSEDRQLEDRTVLIIDDLQAQLVILKLQLKSIGFEQVKTAAGGIAGLHLMQKERFSVVFCDYKMPGFNGDEVVSKFREWECVHRRGEPVQPIYGLTSENTAAVFDSCRNVGMQDVFLKPLKPSEALNVLNTQL